MRHRALRRESVALKSGVGWAVGGWRGNPGGLAREVTSEV